MRTILTCIILLALLAVAALYGAVYSVQGPDQTSADYFQRVAEGEK